MTVTIKAAVAGSADAYTVEHGLVKPPSFRGPNTVRSARGKSGSRPALPVTEFELPPYADFFASFPTISGVHGVRLYRYVSNAADCKQYTGEKLS